MSDTEYEIYKAACDCLETLEAHDRKPDVLQVMIHHGFSNTIADRFNILDLSGSTILVTGGAGFIGSHLVDVLLSIGANVIVLDNLVRGRMENLRYAAREATETETDAGTLRIVKGDIRHQRIVNELVAQSDYVYHLAAIRINRCAQNPREAKGVMIDGTMNVLDACVAHKIGKVIMPSSASIYGMAEDFPTKESHHPYNDETLYGAFKCCNEGMLRAYHKMYGLPYVCLRFFNVYGPRMDIYGKYTEVMIKWIELIEDGNPPVIFGDPEQTLDFVYVGDVVDALQSAMQLEISGVSINIGSGRETTLRELAELLIALHYTDLEPIRFSNPSPRSVRRRQAHIGKARAWLRWLPYVDLRTGLQLLIEWRQEQKRKENSCG
jgi:UDP-glucose 4-epimerase